MTGLAWTLFWFTLPMALCFMTKIIEMVFDFWPTRYQTVEKIVYVDRPVTKTIYVNRPNKPPERRKEQRVSKEKVAEEPSFIQDTILALHKLGMKKSEAKKTVAQVYNPNSHSSVELLLKDCISKL